MITPMVGRLVRDPFDREGWLLELKWDGFRAITETDNTGKVKRCRWRQIGLSAMIVLSVGVTDSRKCL